MLFNKTVSEFGNFHIIFYKNMGVIILKSQELSPVYRIIIRSSISLYMFEALSICKYTRLTLIQRAISR